MLKGGNLSLCKSHFHIQRHCQIFFHSVTTEPIAGNAKEDSQTEVGYASNFPAQYTPFKNLISTKKC